METRCEVCYDESPKRHDFRTVKLVSSCNPRKSSCQEAGWYSGGEVGVGVRATEAKLMRSRWYSGGEVGVGVQAKEAKLPRSRDGAVGVVV
ncbi:hypothetical protein PR001_g7336 [Phytophthora rubi]|uniref:Uncharacterized protein n=1 Tax=Phytophthora rubi TaxID=129364 RepID=A0A6A3N6J4_9STRA|nr:hypothetical protein PR001_g7336 [Phytophthora rubi]